VRPPSIDDRLRHEVEHGRTSTAAEQAETFWTSPAGEIRRQRRAAFLTRDLPRSTRVLEVGAGTGLQTRSLLESFDHVVGIDISPDLLAVAERRAPGAKYLVMDAHRPEFPAGSFDAIVGVSILHHLDWDVALGSYYRLLAPGGVVRFSEPNLANPQIYVQKNVPWIKQRSGDSPDEYAFTRWEGSRSLEAAGFVEADVRPFEFLHPATPKPLIGLVTKFEELVHRTLLREIAGSLLLRARKPR
jgi:ubiquinone/menaquinone biosynthesis C-methylase UbiE